MRAACGTALEPPSLQPFRRARHRRPSCYRHYWLNHRRKPPSLPPHVAAFAGGSLAALHDQI